MATSPRTNKSRAVDITGYASHETAAGHSLHRQILLGKPNVRSMGGMNGESTTQIRYWEPSLSADPGLAETCKTYVEVQQLLAEWAGPCLHVLRRFTSQLLSARRARVTLCFAIKRYIFLSSSLVLNTSCHFRFSPGFRWYLSCLFIHSGFCIYLLDHLVKRS